MTFTTLRDIVRVGTVDDDQGRILLRYQDRYFRVGDDIAAELAAFQQSGADTVPPSSALDALAAALAAPARRRTPIRLRREVDLSRAVAVLAVRSGALFRHPPALWSLAAIGIVVHLLFAARAPLPAHALPLPPAGYAIVAMALVAIAIAHEFAHATAARSLGVEAGRIGIGVMFIYPVFYADVSAAWALSRRHRVVVNAAGLLVQSAIGIVLVAVDAGAFGGASPILGKIIWLNMAAVAINLVPFLKMDGYWLLSDATGVENLDAQARRALTTRVRGLFGRDARPVGAAWLSAYQLAKIGFALLLLRHVGAALAQVWSDRATIATAVSHGMPVPHPAAIVIVLLLAARLAPSAYRTMDAAVRATVGRGIRRPDVAAVAVVQGR